MNQQALADRFEADRDHLRAVAYRLLGSTHDADDAVQASWVKVSRHGIADVKNLTGWFTTVTARECLDRLRERKRRAEVLVADEVTPAAASPAAGHDGRVGGPGPDGGPRPALARPASGIRAARRLRGAG